MNRTIKITAIAKFGNAINLTATCRFYGDTKKGADQEKQFITNKLHKALRKCGFNASQITIR